MDKHKKLAGKRYSQNDLRRLMLEQKTKAGASKPVLEKINSPLAKYDSLGNLQCVLCRATIKAANVWKVHINSKQHKQKVEEAKQLKDKVTKGEISMRTIANEKVTDNASNTKNLKASESLATVPLTKGKKCDHIDVEKKSNEECTVGLIEELLPEKFFDDPIADAKVRNMEYKDPQDEEWERFQKEIKEEATMSNAIIAGEQYESAVMREIEEIDEQMGQWARVIDLEQKKVLSLQKLTRKCVESLSESSADEGNESFDEFSDWRSKKFHK